MAVGDYEFDLDRRVARQFGDPDCGTGMPTAFSEKLHKQFRSRIDDLGLLVEARRRGDESPSPSAPGADATGRRALP